MVLLTFLNSLALSSNSLGQFMLFEHLHRLVPTPLSATCGLMTVFIWWKAAYQSQVHRDAF